MKRNYKISERDFRPFAYSSWHRDPMTVDEKSLTVMLRIEQTMHQLEAMGDDEQRSLWIEVKMPKRKHETLEPAPTLMWLMRVSTFGRTDVMTDNGNCTCRSACIAITTMC